MTTSKKHPSHACVPSGPGILIFLLCASAWVWGQEVPETGNTDPAPAGAALQEEAPAAEESAPDIPVQSLTGPLELLIHPDYPPEQARLVYQPLVDYLNDIEGLTIELLVSRNFHRYWIDARRGQAPALILENAHMVAWRMQQFDFMPLVTTSEPLTYSLLADGALAEAGSGELFGRRIASLPAPSLGYLVLARWFPNPLQQPQIISTATSWLDAVEMVFSAEVDAAVAPDNLAERYPNLQVIETSPEFPGLTLAASPDVPEDVRERLIDALITLQDDPDHHAALFELDIDQFIAADPARYQGLEDWLGSIFGT